MYQNAIRDEECSVRLQVFRMVLCGIPRSGKTTFWKRLAIKDFKPSEESASTGAAESHYISAVEKKKQKGDQMPHVHTEMLFDLKLSSEGEEDLDHEALTIYKHIILSEKNKSQDTHEVEIDSVESHDEAETHTHESLESQPHEGEMDQIQHEPDDIQKKTRKSLDKTNESQPHELLESHEDFQVHEKETDETHKYEHNTREFQSLESETGVSHAGAQQLELQTQAHQASVKNIKPANRFQSITNTEINQSSLSASYQSDLTETGTSLPMTIQEPHTDPTNAEIDEQFNKLDCLLRKGESTSDLPNIKKMCHLQDVGGQRAFLELLPTLSVGKALYLIFFNYENFRTTVTETVQMKASSDEVPTGTEYEQIDVIMQSLICVSTASASCNNLALLIGTHVDKVKQEDVNRVDRIIYEKVKPFLRSTLVYAESGDEKMLKRELILKVAIEKNGLCKHEPENYGKIVMNIVEKKLSCSESEVLPASWYMFYVILHRLQKAGYSVLQYKHCEHIADKLHIKHSHLPGLLERLHKVLGVVLHFRQVKGLENIVICDPAFVHRSISKLIFKTFHDPSPDSSSSHKLKQWGMFEYEDLQKLEYEDLQKLEYEDLQKLKYAKNCNLEMEQLSTLLEHLGVIVPIQSCSPSVEPAFKDDGEQSEADNVELKCLLIPCVLRDAKLWDLEVQILDAQACSIIPLRIYFDCGFAPMGGFCYLFAKLISNNKGWKLSGMPKMPDKNTKEPDEHRNTIYWRNKVTLEVKLDNHKFMVTLLSTDEYYEIHIMHCASKDSKPFQLQSDGHSICKHIWEAIHKILDDSPNKSLKAYKVACICSINHQESNDHVMKFNCIPHDRGTVDRVAAQCLKNDATVTLEASTHLSIMVWFEVLIYYCIDGNYVVLLIFFNAGTTYSCKRKVRRKKFDVCKGFIV